jgi:hypothetical protein
VIEQPPDVARKLHGEYVKFLASVGTKAEYLKHRRTLKLEGAG